MTVFSQTDVSKAPVVAATPVAAGDGSFSTKILVTGPTTITVNFSTADNNGYATGCAQTLGV